MISVCVSLRAGYPGTGAGEEWPQKGATPLTGTLVGPMPLAGTVGPRLSEFLMGAVTTFSRTSLPGSSHQGLDPEPPELDLQRLFPFQFL